MDEPDACWVMLSTGARFRVRDDWQGVIQRMQLAAESGRHYVELPGVPGCVFIDHIAAAFPLDPSGK